MQAFCHTFDGYRPMRLLHLYILLLFPWWIHAQSAWCDLDRLVVLNQDNPAYRSFLQKIDSTLAHHPVQSRSVIYIPVVIHVVATADQQPISRAQALQQLDVVNLDFAGQGENIYKLLPDFEPLVKDAEIRFCLATIDPDGGPTTGITFTQTTVPNIALETGQEGRVAIHYDQLGGKTGWDPERYLNIWVGEYGDLLGSASFPGMAPFPEEEGVVVDIYHFGSIGDGGASGFYGRGHTLTHEIGHFLGLKHIWGQGLEYTCDDSDDVEDTPNASGPYYNCPTGVQWSCDASNMYQNFMDFTDDRCLAAFTSDQVQHMQAVLEIFYTQWTSSASCLTYADSFDTWYSELTWAYDAGSRRWVIYHDVVWTGDRRVEVFSADGRLVSEGQWHEELSYMIDLSRVGSGVYFVKISQGEAHEVRKIAVY